MGAGIYRPLSRTPDRPRRAWLYWNASCPVGEHDGPAERGGRACAAGLGRVPRARGTHVDPAVESRLASVLATRLRDARDELTHRWFERISERVTLERERVFPSEDLLDHMPLLIDGIAEFVAEPGLPIGSDSAVVDRARELGALRHAQGFDEYEILKEFEIFGGVLFAFLRRTVDDLDDSCSRVELAMCSQRI